MATKKSPPYSITSTTDGGVSSSNKYVAEFNNIGELLAIYKKDSVGDFKILDPTSAEWSAVSTAKGSGFTGLANSSGETLLQYNQNKHRTIGEWETSTPIAPQYLTRHTEIKNKEINAAAIPAGDTSEGAREIIATSQRVRTPQQFASPSSPGYAGGARAGGGNNGKANTSTFAYPYDMDLTQDHLKITRYLYNRDGGVNFSAPGDSKKLLGTSRGSVILPMPKASEAGGAEWGESRVDVLGIGAATVFGAPVNAIGDLATGDKPLENIKSRFKIGDLMGTIDRVKDAGATAAGAAAIVGARYASQAVGMLGITISQEDLITRTTGKAINPNAELLFRGPVLRDFGFRFTMIARNDTEAKEIRKIVQFFKAGSTPKYENAAFLGSPDIFQLEYKPQTVLNKFKPMSLNKVTIDYAPDGYWAAYEDSHPVSIVMSLEFSEIVPVYDKDYDITDDTVGF